jgi:hypothetical protein
MGIDSLKTAFMKPDLKKHKVIIKHDDGWLIEPYVGSMVASVAEKVANILQIPHPQNRYAEPIHDFANYCYGYSPKWLHEYDGNLGTLLNKVLKQVQQKANDRNYTKDAYCCLLQSYILSIFRIWQSDDNGMITGMVVYDTKNVIDSVSNNKDNGASSDEKFTSLFSIVCNSLSGALTFEEDILAPLGITTA